MFRQCSSGAAIAAPEEQHFVAVDEKGEKEYADFVCSAR